MRHIIDRDCVDPNSKYWSNIDHIAPISGNSGRNALWNMQPVSKEFNSLKSDKNSFSFEGYTYSVVNQLSDTLKKIYKLDKADAVYCYYIRYKNNRYAVALYKSRVLLIDTKAKNMWGSAKHYKMVKDLNGDNRLIKKGNGIWVYDRGKNSKGKIINLLQFIKEKVN